MTQAPTPLPHRVVVLQRGEPPTITPDPWSTDGAARIERLAQAIASSPAWNERKAAVLVVRTTPHPLIAAVGRFDDGDVRWLEIAAQQAEQVMPTLCLLDSNTVEATVATLADELVQRFGRERLDTFRYAAVPRGGLFVLGTLAYLLDLPRERLAETHVQSAGRDEVPLVLVDDIAISGLRLSQVVADHPGRSIVVAAVHAHPALRAGFVDAHPNVTAFVSAIDLVDHAPATLGAGYEDWRSRWRARAESGTVWIGQADHVVYPWNEPDLGVWNDVTEREELGWSLVPPGLCLKRRGAKGIAVQRMPEPGSGLRAHDEVISAEWEDHVVVGHTGSATSYELNGVAADIWRALMVHGDPDAAAKELVSTYGVAVDNAIGDVTGFISDLLAAGLLIETHA